MKPTYLYIKQHNITGLKYFGKTTRDPFKYRGSGLHWKRHLRVHGNDVTTVWVQAFFDRKKLEEYALRFSKDNMIVESTEWANMKVENGLDGGRDAGFIGHKWNDEERAQISERMSRNNPMYDPKVRQKHSETMKSDLLKQRRSISKKGNTNTKGKTWFNNGEITKMFVSPPDDSWKPGRLNPHWNNNRKNDDR